MSFDIDRYQFKPVFIDADLQNDRRPWQENATQIRIEEGALLFREGTYSKGLYILTKGKVKISQVSKRGDEQIVYIYGVGDAFGYRPLICKEPHPVSATVLEDCEIMFLAEKEFRELLEESPELTKSLLVNLAHEFGVWINTITVLSQEATLERIAFVLLLLNYRSDTDDSQTIINVSRQTFASYARTTIETLARTLSKLKKQGIVEITGRKIVILDIDRLKQIADFN